MKRAPIYVEARIDCPLEALWDATQQPALHQQWDLRFTEITYLPRPDPAAPQQFVYGTRIGFGLGVAVRLAAGEAPVPGSVGDWFWSGVGGTYFWVDPTAGFFALLMLQTSSAVQRQHYRTLTRAMVYAALDGGAAP